MTSDLFFTRDTLEHIPLQDAELYYQSHLAFDRPMDAILRELIAKVPWRVEKIKVWGKMYDQPRLIAWYGDEGCGYTYSSIYHAPLPWTPLLLELKNRIESITQTTFNSVLLNYYRDHRDSMGFHSDDERELGEQPIIASLSLGAERIFILKHKTQKTIKPVHLTLASGSLLVMKGETQRYWKHGINKEVKLCGPRVNLTFRRIIS